MSKRRKRILFVENVPEKIGALTRSLQARGYEVEVITDYEVAKHKLNCQWVPLAVVDIRLVDDQNPQDFTGLKLVTEETDRSIRKLILTAWPTWEATRQALVGYSGELPPAIDFLNKLDRIDDLVNKIEAAYSSLGINWDLEVDFDSPLTFLCMADWLHRKSPVETEVCQDLLESGEELQDLWSMLFAGAERIILYPLPPGCGETLVAKVKPYTQTGPDSIVVAKCGWKDDIRLEKQKYEDFVDRKLQAHPYLFRYVETLHFSGLIYSCVRGGDASGESAFEHAERFADYYRAEPSKQVNKITEHLLSGVFAGWRAQRGIKPPTTLDQEYRQATGLDQKREKLERKFDELLGSPVEAGLISSGKLALAWQDGLTLKRSELLSWIYDTAKVLRRIDPDLSLTDYPCVISHGDLNGGNILVDAKEEAWVIDFSKAGYGYILRDYAELETVISLDLMRVTDTSSLVKFERTVCGQPEISRTFIEPLQEYSHREPELDKALRVIQKLRELASARDDSSIKRYYLALLFEAARRMVVEGRDSPSSTDPLHRRAHAALRVACLIETLKQQ